ncbi:hypothetical protein DFJ74DRAFT_688389 [Hyaloraphidium curvatum]|nr:hypothetical protein DFJ74DRAFT_688389 [Hyaloraphidium curvatum]
MVYRTPHGLEARYVEPLVGGLRHPHVCRSFPEAWNREFLLPERRGDPREPAPRSLFFDLGAGAWAEGIGGASPSFFHAVYRRGGLGFARMFLWEATRTDPVAFFRGVPEDMRPRVQFYNVPVEKESNGLFSVFNAVLAEAAPEDHVVLKVDIDSPGLEDEIVAHLASTPKLAALVDEVYYEHHADWMPMAKTWSCHVVKCPPLRASYDVFGQLRRLGIRAHSWT